MVSEPKTAKGRRVVALDPGTIEVLKDQAARQLDEQSQWDEGWVETGLVFTAENGDALDPESVSRYWRQAVKKTMLPHDPATRPAAHPCHAGTAGRRASQGRLRAAGARDRLDHARYLLARHPAMQEEAAALIAGLVFAK